MSAIGDVLRDLDDHTPRVVAELASADYEIEFMREDIENLYSVEDLDQAYRLVMANQVTGDEFRRLIGRGNYNAQMLYFDDIVVMLFHSDRYEAIFASFDFDEEFPGSRIVSEIAAQTPDSDEEAAEA